MNTAPLISVCMPLYNTRRFIAEAVQGVMQQTYPHWELIVCDNCSTDGSAEIVAELARKDSRVRLVRNQRNLGYAGNLHKVTSLARGDLMMIHCADDTAEPEALRRTVETFQRGDDGLGMVITDAYVIDASGQRREVIAKHPERFENAFVPIAEYHHDRVTVRFTGREALRDALPRLKIVGWQGAIIFKREVFDAVEGVYNGLTHSPDKHFIYNLLSKTSQAVWLPEPLFSWRVHEDNQHAQNRNVAVPKQALDAYHYTFEYPADYLAELGTTRDALAKVYVDFFCLRKALVEVRGGATTMAFRYLCLALASYPGIALRNAKFYVAAAGCLTGPIGTWVARLGYRIGWWRRSAVKLKTAPAMPVVATPKAEEEASG